MLSTAYDLKTDVYFPYPPAITSTMMAPNFPQYNVPLQSYELAKDENFSRTIPVQEKPGENYQAGTSCQQKPDSCFEDEESRKKYTLLQLTVLVKSP